MAKPTTDDQSTKLQNALLHSAGVGLGWFTLALLARQLVDVGGRSEDRKRQQRLAAAVNARYPIFTPDFNVKDTAKEQELLNTGIAKESAAAEPEPEKKKNDGWGLFNKFINPIPMEGRPSIGKTLSTTAAPQIHPAHIAFTIAAMAAGGLTGWKLSDVMASKRKSEELDKRIAEARNRIDRLFAEEFQRTRGLEKTSEDGDYSVPSKLTAGFSKLYLLYAAGIAAMSFGLSKAYLDSMDNRRERLKDLERYARERARLTGGPVTISGLGMIPGGKSGVPGSTEELRHIVDTDARDPMGGLIGGKMLNA